MALSQLPALLRKSVARWEEWLRLGTGWQLVRWRREDVPSIEEDGDYVAHDVHALAGAGDDSIQLKTPYSLLFRFQCLNSVMGVRNRVTTRHLLPRFGWALRHFAPRPLPTGMITPASRSWPSTWRIMSRLTLGQAFSISVMLKSAMKPSIALRIISVLLPCPLLIRPIGFRTHRRRPRASKGNTRPRATDRDGSRAIPEKRCRGCRSRMASIAR